MADTDHVSELDEFDVQTVWLYRVGIVGAAAGLLLLAAAEFRQVWELSFPDALDPVLTGQTPVLVLCFGCALIVTNLHLYNKKIRWMIRMSAWVGVMLLLAMSESAGAATSTVEIAGVGFIFMCLSSIAMKEQLCFQLPGLRLVPLLLVVALIPMVTGQHVVAGALLTAVGVLYLFLAIAKLRMPVHYDIGDKNRYDP